MKAVFIDLDGTFLDENKKIPRSNLQILDRLYHQGIYVVPATGRSLTGIPEILIKHPCVSYAICCNGAVIYDLKDEKVLKKYSLDKKTICNLYDQLKGFDIQFDVFADNHIYSERNRLERLDEFQLDSATYNYVKQVRVPIDEEIPSFVNKCTRIDRTNFFYKDLQTKNELINIVKAYPDLICLSSLPTNLEVMCKEAHKGNAIKWLLNYLDINSQEAVAFGDSNNDVTMLEFVGDGVAMENACKECKSIANHTCESNDEAGVANYLNKLLEEN